MAAYTHRCCLVLLSCWLTCLCVCVVCRNKSVLTNTISKLERRINELSDQMEEEHRIATEQKDLVTHTLTHSHTHAHTHA